MLDQDWVQKVRQYRLAVDTYCDAIDRTGDDRSSDDRTANTGDLGPHWHQVEAAHEEAERARYALLRQQPRRSSHLLQAWAEDDLPNQFTEDLVLGDVGQHGG